MAHLKNRRVAILAADGFEDIEFTEPKAALENAGAKVDVVSLRSGSVRAKKGDDWTKSYTVDRNLDDASEKDYDALMIPGGVVNPDSCG